MKKIGIGILILVGLVAGIWWYGNRTEDTGKNYSDSFEIGKIKEKGVLKVGTDANYNPMEFMDQQGNIVGYDIDFAKLIAKEIGVSVEFVNLGFGDIFNQLNQGKIDMIVSSLTINPERSKTMSFSIPYFNAGQIVLANSDNKSLITKLADLKEKKIGVFFETTSHEEAKKLTDSGDIKEYSDTDKMAKDILSGIIDAVIIDSPPGYAMVKKYPQLSMVVSPFTQEFYGVAVPKGKEDLINMVNNVIRDMANSSTKAKLEKIWLK